jgi:hypothetical protein
MARRFTFASLLATTAAVAASGGALAGSHHVEQQAAQNAPPPTATVAEATAPAAKLEGRWQVKAVGDELQVELILVNTDDAAADVVRMRGHSPGPSVAVQIGGQDTQLAQVLGQAEMQDMMSRMGPMPVWAAVAPHDAMLVGTYRFTIPEEARGKSLRIVANVDGRAGTTQLVWEGIPSAAGV